MAILCWLSSVYCMAFGRMETSLYYIYWPPGSGVASAGMPCMEDIMFNG
jgi:hypothetical protein